MARPISSRVTVTAPIGASKLGFDGEGARPAAPSPEVEGPARSDARPGTHPLELAVLAVAFVVGLVVRWNLVQGPLGYVDLDEATAGIAGRRFFSSPAVFFPAQPYGGTPESALVGLVHLVVGSGPVPLKLTAAVLHLVACVLVWDAARRIVPSRAGQLAAPILLWLGPAAGVWESTKERGFYGAAIVVAAALLAVAARLDRRVTPRGLVGYGLLVGVGWWVSPLLLFVAVPATVWLLVRDPVRLDHWPKVLAAGAVGALPWLVWNLVHGFRSLRQPPSLGTDLIQRFGDGLAKLAVLTGLETPWDPDRTLVPGARAAAIVLVAVAVGVCLLRHPETGSSLAGAVVVGYLLLYPLANNTGTVGADPRYLYPLLPALALATACLLPSGRPPRDRAEAAPVGGEWRDALERPALSRPASPVVAALAAVAVGAAVWATTGWGLTGMEAARGNDSRFLEAPGTSEVIDLLEQRGVTFAVTDLAGAQITYATDGRIQASSFMVPRFPELERLMANPQPSTYVLDETLGGNASRLEWWLAVNHVGYERVRIGVWTVIFVDEWVPPWRAELFTLQGPVGPPA